MKTLFLAGVAALLLGGCASNKSATVVDPTGPRSPLANPADNSLNSPTTGPSSAGLPGGPIGSPPNAAGTAPTTVGRF